MATSESGDRRRFNTNKQNGESIEKYRARARDGERVPDIDYFDVEAGDGTLVEVKSTRRRLHASRRGRFNIEKNNHQNLLDHGGEYDLLVLSEPPEDPTAGEDPDVLAEKTMTAEAVEEARKEQDLKWPNSGKLKIPWAYLIETDEVAGE